MGDYFNSFNIDLSDNLKYTLIAIGIFCIFILLRKVFTKYIYIIILKLTKKTPTDFFTNVWVAFERPLRFLFIAIGLYISLQYFPYINVEDNELYAKIYHTIIIILITWGVYNLTSTSSVLFNKLNEKYDFDIDDILIPFLSRTLQVIVIIIGFSVIVQVFDYSINSIVAGLGIGGLAVALAAQDALSNLFGGIVIITEKPFSINDWIETNSVEGTVEDISFRSTKIRTFAQALVVVPNATLAKEAITNWSEMGKRRIAFQLGLSHETSIEQLENVVTKIRLLLTNHNKIHQETIFVTFDTFNTSSLDINLYFFTKTTVWGDYLLIKEEINFEILTILAEENVGLARPTRKLYVKEDEGN